MSTTAKPITCKAAVVWEFNQPVAIETVTVLPPGKGEVRVKIHSSSLCQGDIHALGGHFPGKLLPFVLGHEGAGEVESVGEGVNSVKKGDKVLTNFISQCKNCSYCADDRTNFCSETGRVNPTGFFGRCLPFDGTSKFICKGKPLYMFTCCSSFAEYTVIPEASCLKINPKAPLDKVSVFACAYPTGYGSAAKVVDIRPTDIVAVWGIGGVGLPAVVGCRDKKAKQIIGINRSAGKEALARKYGCTDFISTADLKEPLADKIKALTNGHGLDFAIMCGGDGQAIETAIGCLGKGGSCVLVIGADKMTLSPMSLLSNRQTVKGAGMGGYKVRDEIPPLVDRYLEGKLPADELITGYFKLEQINEIIELMKTSKSIRSVIKMDV